ncbi:MAG: HU family DNA-binding protein [bacterium]|nr:HU family DNA-binding protein [bacterium]
MTKQQMFDVLARKAHLTKKASREAVETLLDEIKKALAKGEKVVLSGFGTFKVVTVKDKPVIVPGTKERKIVKGHRAARFTPGKTLKKAVK